MFGGGGISITGLALKVLVCLQMALRTFSNWDRYFCYLISPNETSVCISKADSVGTVSVGIF